MANETLKINLCCVDEHNKLNTDMITKTILQKNPIICFTTEEKCNNIFDIANISRNYAKNILVTDEFDLARVFSYLSSFQDVTKKQILIVAPIEDKKAAILFAKKLLDVYKENFS